MENTSSTFADVCSELKTKKTRIHGVAMESKRDQLRNMVSFEAIVVAIADGDGGAGAFCSRAQWHAFCLCIEC